MNQQEFPVIPWCGWSVPKGLKAEVYGTDTVVAFGLFGKTGLIRCLLSFFEPLFPLPLEVRENGIGKQF